MTQVDGPIIPPDETWEQVVELAVCNFRSAREQIAYLVVTSARAEMAKAKRKNPARWKVTADVG